MIGVLCFAVLLLMGCAQATTFVNVSREPAGLSTADFFQPIRCVEDHYLMVHTDAHLVHSTETSARIPS